MRVYAVLVAVFLRVDPHHGLIRALIVSRLQERIPHRHLDVRVSEVTRDDGQRSPIHDPPGRGRVMKVVEVEVEDLGGLDARLEPVVGLSERRLHVFLLAAQNRAHGLAFGECVVCLDRHGSHLDVPNRRRLLCLPLPSLHQASVGGRSRPNVRGRVPIAAGRYGSPTPRLERTQGISPPAPS